MLPAGADGGEQRATIMREDTVTTFVLGATILATVAALYVWIATVEVNAAEAVDVEAATEEGLPSGSLPAGGGGQAAAAIPLATFLTATPESLVPTKAAAAPVDPAAIPTAALITATPSPRPETLNGIPMDDIIVLPPGVRANMRLVFSHGQSLGRNPSAFSKVGDSTVENLHFLSRFDEGPYNLGAYAFLTPVIATFSGSFARDSIAVRLGFHSWSAFDPFWADADLCEPNEGPLPCELRLQNPSVVFIRLGVNDTSAPASFDSNMRDLVAYCLEQGVIPVLGTKADRLDGPGNTNNEILRAIAADYEIPLWDFDRVAGTLPDRGLGPDGVHMTSFYSHDYSDPAAFTTGHSVHNLTALLMLDALWREVMGGRE